jgi:hypothetical protein
MHALGYEWKYADDWSTLTTEGFQMKLLATKRGQSDPLSFTVVSRPCARTFEASESALLHALDFINDVYGYHIGDLHFTDYIMRRSQLWR